MNEQHWWIIGATIGCAAIFWFVGCESTTTSMLNPDHEVNRDELQAEIDYLVAQSRARMSDIDKQDAIKQFALDQLTVIGTAGTVNPAGLLNALITIGAISFGLNRNQKLKQVTKHNSTNGEN